MKRIFSAVMTLLMAGSVCAAAPEADLEKGKELAETICAACHGVDGNSEISIYPRLAGQHEAYLDAQAIAIRDNTRTWGMAAAMQPLVEEMTDEDLRNINAYYATQLAKPGEADPQGDLELGKQVYRGGIRHAKVPACMSCHGPNGAGIPGGSVAKDGITAYPRISGQHKDYIVEQMNAFRDGSRSHAMMDPIATRLSDEEIEAVANYIQGLH